MVPNSQLFRLNAIEDPYKAEKFSASLVGDDDDAPKEPSFGGGAAIYQRGRLFSCVFNGINLETD